jgi:exopolyphosphatase/pppGpp-phosphohydrolase
MSSEARSPPPSASSASGDTRAGVILAGACIVRVVLAKRAQDRLTVSDRGLRRGLLTERFGD